MAEHVRLTRYPAPESLVGLIDWFWSVEWELPTGVVHPQQVVPQPGVNVSVGTPPPPGTAPEPGPWPLRCVVNGVTTTLSTRVLSGTGWNLAAKTTTGGFGAWIDDVAPITDLALPVEDVLPLEGPALSEQIASADLIDGVDVLGDALTSLLEQRSRQRISLAREVAAVAEVAERDRSVRRVEDMARVAGVGMRTLQRMFASCAGVSPTWVIRRYRLLDAAELARTGTAVDWAEVAAALGYSDQAHLTRDFTTVLGVSPAAYARAQRPD